MVVAMRGHGVARVLMVVLVGMCWLLVVTAMVGHHVLLLGAIWWEIQILMISFKT